MTHREFILGYGVSGDFGRFLAPVPLDLSRGARAIIRSDRGLEIGQVFRPATTRHAAFLPGTRGQLIRPATLADEETAEQLAHRAGELLARGSQLIDSLHLPLALLDAEMLFDGEHAVLHYLHWADCDRRELVSTLSRDFAVTVSLVDLTAPPVEHDHGCGDCGSGGGCGSCGEGGGCGSCGSSQPEAVQAHFAGLREKMDKRRVPLL